MKRKKGQKLGSYSAVASTLMSMSGVADAQIIYTDIPDFSGMSGNPQYNIDFDQNGAADFFVKYKKKGSGDQIVAGNQAGTPHAVGVSLGYGSYALALNTNAVINNGLNWAVGGSIIMGWSSSVGKWPGLVDKYLPLRFNISGQNHYGWVRLDVGNNSDQFTIKDFAYNSAAGQQILAGDKGATSIPDGKSEEPKISIDIKDKILSVGINEPLASSVEVTVFNSLGRKVKRVASMDNIKSINLSQASRGIYYVSVLFNDRSVSAKIYLD